MNEVADPSSFHFYVACDGCHRVRYAMMCYLSIALDDKRKNLLLGGWRLAIDRVLAAVDARWQEEEDQQQRRRPLSFVIDTVLYDSSFEM